MKHSCILKNALEHDYIKLLLKPQISLNVNVPFGHIKSN